MKKVLVTGGNGFIGQALCRRLESKCSVISLNREQCDIEDGGVFQKMDKVDHVFHLASRTFVPDSWDEPTKFLTTNVIGTANVLEYCKSFKIPLTYVSAYIYGSQEKLPIKEDSQIKPNNPYALSKFLAEQICHFYAEYHNLNITIIRPFNVYGPGQKGHFLIPKIIDLIKKNETIELLDLTPKRDYIFIDDVVDALMQSFELQLSGCHVFNIGSGISLSVEEVVEQIQRVYGSRLEVKSSNQPRDEEMNNVIADVSKSSTLLKWQPVTSFDVGIGKIISGLSED